MVDDRIFDTVYPFQIRRASTTHWTPVEVAARAATLLAIHPGARVLDIGSGVGKFCIVAAARVDARVHGVEHRPHLIEIAKHAATQVGVDVTFTHGTLASIDAQGIDGAYLFNPFGENLSSSADWIDETVELNEARFKRDAAYAMEFLHATRVGTRVVTYCGFGGEFPPGFSLLRREFCAGRLELWVKTKDAFS